MSGFGALTDHFALTGVGNVFETIGELVDSSETPVSQNRADAQDESGDIAASAWHGNTAGELSEVSCTYAVKSGTLDTSDLQCGEITVGTDKIVITGIEISTSNGEWPQVTVSGTKGTEAITAPTGKLNTYTLPAINVLGMKLAQPLGFTVGNGKLTGSSLSAAVELAQQEDGGGEPVAHGVSGGTIEISADFVRITDAPGWTVSIDYTETQSPSLVEGQAAWHTSTGTAAGTLERDDAP
jgi:hypothetical protein